MGICEGVRPRTIIPLNEMGALAEMKCVQSVRTHVFSLHVVSVRSLKDIHVGMFVRLVYLL